MACEPRKTGLLRGRSSHHYLCSCPSNHLFFYQAQSFTCWSIGPASLLAHWSIKLGLHFACLTASLEYLQGLHQLLVLANFVCSELAQRVLFQFQVLGLALRIWLESQVSWVSLRVWLESQVSWVSLRVWLESKVLWVSLRVQQASQVSWVLFDY